MTLSNKQRMFVEAYLQTWSGAEAARRAGYKHPDRLAYMQLRKLEVQEAIQQRLKETAMQTDEVLARLAEQARVSVADFVRQDAIGVVEENGQQVIIKGVGLDWDAIQARGHLIKSIKQTANGPALELHDAQAALIHIGKHLKLFTDKVEVTGSDGTPLLPVADLVAAMRQAEKETAAEADEPE